MSTKKENPTAAEGILGKNKEKLGTYQEAPGGGKPLAKGEKAPSPEWVRENRKMQPRDEDGKFTYNSANLKPLKYGPSRGETIPPFLRGGINIDFVAVESKTVVLGEDGKRYLLGLNIKKEDIIESYKNYMEDGFIGLESKMKGKRGRVSSFEKEKIEQGVEGILKGLNKKEYGEKYRKDAEYRKSVRRSKYAKLVQKYFKEKSFKWKTA